MYIVLSSSQLYSVWRQAITGDDDDDCDQQTKAYILNPSKPYREYTIQVINFFDVITLKEQSVLSC